MVYLLHEIELSHFSFEQERHYKNGENESRSIQLLYDNHRFTFQTPAVICPFGVSSYETEKTKGWALAMNPEGELLDFFRAMDAWLFAEGELANMGTYIPIVKERPDKPPLVRIKVEPRHLGFLTLDELRREFPYRLRARFIIQLMPVWMVNGKYGVSFRFQDYQILRDGFRDAA